MVRERADQVQKRLGRGVGAWVDRFNQGISVEWRDIDRQAHTHEEPRERL